MKFPFTKSKPPPSKFKPDDLLADLPRGVEDRLREDSWLPHSYFETSEEIASNAFNPDAGHVLLGSINGHAKQLVREDGRSEYPAMRGVTEGHDFELADLKREPVTLYLCLPALRLHTCRGWLRLLINQFLSAMEREKIRPDIPVLTILDEAAVLGRMDEITTAAGLLAGLDVKLWTIFQDLNQAKSIYGDRWETFLGNCGVIQAFGNMDHFTLDHLSKMLGQTIVTTSERSAQSRDQIVGQGASGFSERDHLQALLSPSEISQYFARDDQFCRQLVLLPGRRPYVLSRITHDQHEYFQRKIGVTG